MISIELHDEPFPSDTHLAREQVSEAVAIMLSNARKDNRARRHVDTLETKQD